MISPSEFAKTIGVSKQAVSKAIKAGRIPTYDESGAPAPIGYPGRKFLKQEEAAAAFRLSRARIDDSALAELAQEIERELEVDPTAHEADPKVMASDRPTLVSAKTEKEGLQADLLRLRLEKERGELVSRAAQIAAMETAGRKVARSFQMLPIYAEELHGLAHSGGLPALTAWLRAKANELCASLADTLASPDEELIDEDGDPE